MVFDRLASEYHDEASRFVHLLTLLNPSASALASASASTTDTNFNAVNGRTYLVPEDFVPLVQDVVDTHPGLTFLKEAAEFHSRYVHTVCNPLPIPHYHHFTFIIHSSISIVLNVNYFIFNHFICYFIDLNHFFKIILSI